MCHNEVTAMSYQVGSNFPKYKKYPAQSRSGFPAPANALEFFSGDLASLKPQAAQLLSPPFFPSSTPGLVAPPPAVDGEVGLEMNTYRGDDKRHQRSLTFADRPLGFL